MWAVFVFAALLAGTGAHGYTYPTHGALSQLPQSCLTDLNNIFNNLYLLTSTAPSQDNRTHPWFLNQQRRLGCRLTILEALEQATSDACPPEDQLINCFWVGAQDWARFVTRCELFKSQYPLPACSDAVGEAAEGIPSCNTNGGAAINAGTAQRRLLQNAANSAGIATWSYSNGEAVGLQYDHYAPMGSPYAQPPLAASGLSGTDAAAVNIAAEGSEGGTVSSSGTITATNAGCFPSFWTASDFDQWLNGTYNQPARPKDYGGVNAVGLVSVLIYTILLCSLGAF